MEFDYSSSDSSEKSSSSNDTPEDSPKNRSPISEKGIIKTEFFKEPVFNTLPVTQKADAQKQNIDNKSVKKISSVQNPHYHHKASEKVTSISITTQSS